MPKGFPAFFEGAREARLRFATGRLQFATGECGRPLGACPSRKWMRWPLREGNRLNRESHGLIPATSTRSPQDGMRLAEASSRWNDRRQ